MIGMRRITLYEPPKAFEARLTELKDKPNLGRELAEILLFVECGFALMTLLNLDDEPVSAVWGILSGMPLRHPRLESLDAAKRRAIANARQIIPYSSRFAWISALRDYVQKVPLNWRNYVFSMEELDDQIIHASRRPEHEIRQEHDEIYRECLTRQLFFRRREYRVVKADTTYQFDAHTGDITASVRVQFPRESTNSVPSLVSPWLLEPRAREAFSVCIDDLEHVAKQLDAREAALAARYNWHESELGQWCRRYTTINFHTVQADKTLSQRNEHHLKIDGFTHLAGMVGAGKSTLAQLLAAYILYERPQLRMTLVGGDVQTAIQLANHINWWFCDDPEHDDPVAVPLLGRSRRDTHLRGLYGSQDYITHIKRGQSHWGERWLNIACAVQGLLSSEQRNEYLNGKPLLPGTEPCQSLREPVTDTRKTPGSLHLCPLFAGCPSQQLYRDMPLARVWITTPGALAMSSPPRHLETRPLKIGELVYEQSDIVVFDEADTIIQWFDNVFAETVSLTSGGSGLFDRTPEPTEAFMKFDRVRSHVTRRWVGAHRDVLNLITTVLTLLHPSEGHEVLRQWIKRGYFTPHTLCYRLARRIAGVPEFDERTASDALIEARDRAIQEISKYFDRLLDQDDPLRMVLQATAQPDPAFALSQIMQQINSNGESATDEAIYLRCRDWIARFFPDTEQRLTQRRMEIEQQATHDVQQSKRRRKGVTRPGVDEVDTLETLAYRLQFTLSVILLDRHSRIVFYEWQNRPVTIQDEQPQRRMPAAMLDILPLPPTGRQFGTYYAQQPGDSTRNADHLSLFAYTNIGRTYVLNYHRLLSDLDGRRGPNVLALSGTSYLPDSTAFHVSEPQGTLLPDEKVRDAIRASRFRFLPQLDRNRDRAIRISGAPEQQKPGLFRDIVNALAGENGMGLLAQDLEELTSLGECEPEHWSDRSRLLLLVNSYDQARWAAKELQQRWPSYAKHIFYVRRADSRTDDHSDEGRGLNDRDELGALNRTDIERFPQTAGRILVAPMNAIGRGFNIRNDAGKAAFGAVYFLTRPYPHPRDTQAIVQEINRRALDWVDDPDFDAWKGDGILGRAQRVRNMAAAYWRSVEQRSYYRTLHDDEVLRSYPRYDLAATTAGYIVQAVGRLLRGGVPFHAYFVDAAWAPNSADYNSDTLDTEKTSLLVAVILRLAEYSATADTVGWALYKPLADALERTDNLRW